MTRNGTAKGTSGFSRLLSHAALWFGLLFATPLFVALHNVEGTGFAPGKVAAWAGLLTLVASVLSWLFASLLPGRLQKRADTLVLALAILLAIWGNGVHGLFEFGVFDGRPIDFREHKVVFWLEGIAWLGGLLLLIRLMNRLTAIPPWLPALPVLSSCLLLAPAVLNPPQKGLEAVVQETVDPSVYDFSSIANLVHLLPDGFQGDTVREALEKHPELAARFDGFTLFTDHLGRYPGTAPSLYTMLTGEPFPLQRGFSYSWVGPETQKRSYQNELAQQGFQVDMVPISNYICPKNASSCHPRPFKNSGYAQDREKNLRYSISLLADLSLFRLAPLFLKERIYDEGYWLLSDIAAGDDAPVPDPILREWTQNMRVVHDRPVYKWYHYVGTHVPPRWNAMCEMRRTQERVSANYEAQARCILTGIANFIDRLKAAGIYDRTAIVISGDHGHNTVPTDQVSEPLNYGMYAPLLGTGRPALLLKPGQARGPLRLSSKPTHLLNIAPTVRALAGLPRKGQSVFDIPKEDQTARVFHHYPVDPFWSGNPVPHLEYTIEGPAHRAEAWKMTGIVRYGSVPSAYRPVNRNTAKDLVYGARLRRSFGQAGSSWIKGRQLAFVTEIPESGVDGWLELELAFPHWVKTQSFTVQINGGEPWPSGEIDGSGSGDNWITFRVPVSPSDLRDGPDFVSTLFDRVYEDPDDEGTVAARVRSIHLSHGPTN